MHRYRKKHQNPIRGFGGTFGFTWLYLTGLVLLPLSALVYQSSKLSAVQFWAIVTSPRVLASYQLSFGASLAAAAINCIFGLLLAWILVRYEFPGRRMMDAMIDLPFALPTAVAGLALTALYSEKGWVGGFLSELGIKVAYSRLGVLVALIFIGLPFIVRSVQPVLSELDTHFEEAAATLGASTWQRFRFVIFTALAPALLTGFALAFARAIGEYGSVIFIAGNIPMVSEITPLMVVTKLEQYDYAGATAISIVLLAMSFLLLFLINSLQQRSIRYRLKESI